MGYNGLNAREGGIKSSRQGVKNKSTMKKADIIDALEELVHDETYKVKFKETMMNLKGKSFIDALAKVLKFVRVEKSQYSIDPDTLDKLGVIKYPTKNDNV